MTLTLIVGIPLYLYIGYWLTRRSLDVWGRSDNRSRLAFLLFPHSYHDNKVGHFDRNRMICNCWNRRTGLAKNDDCTTYTLVTVSLWPCRMLLCNLPCYLFYGIQRLIRLPQARLNAQEEEIPGNIDALCLQRTKLIRARESCQRQLTALERDQAQVEMLIDLAEGRQQEEAALAAEETGAVPQDGGEFLGQIKPDWWDKDHEK